MRGVGLADKKKLVLSPALVQSVDQHESPPLSSPTPPPLMMEMLHSEILVRGLPWAESLVELCSPLFWSLLKSKGPLFNFSLSRYHFTFSLFSLFFFFKLHIWQFTEQSENLVKANPYLCVFFFPCPGWNLCVDGSTEADGSIARPGSVLGIHAPAARWAAGLLLGSALAESGCAGRERWTASWVSSGK